MSTQEQDAAGPSGEGEETCRRLIKEWNAAYNARDAEKFASCYAQDAVVTDPVSSEPLRGRKAVQQDVAAFLEALPDTSAELQEVLVDGSTVATRVLITGTQTGPMPTPSGPIPPTGRPVKVPMGVFSRFGSDSKIIEEYRYYDLAGMAEQLGGE
ncbi:UNVERIFIED_CONTAM: SgcJ/EcaC family oxidoreductase [Kocuria sp. CPCC 205316]|uniref:ester cyclase n=1 Tax=Kocuria TaxID=57493 RepID=UPI0036DD1AE5